MVKVHRHREVGSILTLSTEHYERQGNLSGISDAALIGKAIDLAERDHVRGMEGVVVSGQKDVHDYHWLNEPYDFKSSQGVWLSLASLDELWFAQRMVREGRDVHYHIYLQLDAWHYRFLGTVSFNSIAYLIDTTGRSPRWYLREVLANLL